MEPFNLIGERAMKIRLAALLSSLALSLSPPANAASAASVECLLDWAETAYPILFAPAGAVTAQLPPYSYRYYSATQAYVGAADDMVYYLGPLTENVLTPVGLLMDWLVAAGCASATAYAPARISATWNTISSGDPTDRRDIAATEWTGDICDPRGLYPTLKTIAIEDLPSTTMLYVENRQCNLTVTIGVCLTAGSLPGPSDGSLEECADDPYATAPANLHFLQLAPGYKAYVSTVNPGASVNIFYCSDNQSLYQGVVPSVSGPLSCLPH
jgi:hypothetical protein